MSLRIVEWKTRVEGRKFYIGGETAVILGCQSANLPAPGFYFSVYAYSPFFQEIVDAHLLEFEDLSDPAFTTVLEYIGDEVGDYFRGRQAEISGELIQELKNAGIYPYEGDPKNEVEKNERQLFDIATHAVSSYSLEFKRGDNASKRITLRLLRETISHNPESLSNILRAVFNLPKYRQNEFASLLKKTALGNIITASSLIADRVVALKVLREVVFDPSHRKTIQERGELDALIRDNTWIFVEKLHLTMSEIGLTKIMNRVSQELALRRSKTGKVRKLDGRIGRIPLWAELCLVRIANIDNFFC